MCALPATVLGVGSCPVRVPATARVQNCVCTLTRTAGRHPSLLSGPAISALPPFWTVAAGLSTGPDDVNKWAALSGRSPERHTTRCLRKILRSLRRCFPLAILGLQVVSFTLRDHCRVIGVIGKAVDWIAEDVDCHHSRPNMRNIKNIRKDGIATVTQSG